eukprot:10542481-Prorocentrum_lima.AAC.1
MPMSSTHCCAARHSSAQARMFNAAIHARLQRLLALVQHTTDARTAMARTSPHAKLLCKARVMPAGSAGTAAASMTIELKA